MPKREIKNKPKYVIQFKPKGRNNWKLAIFSTSSHMKTVLEEMTKTSNEAPAIKGIWKVDGLTGDWEEKALADL